MRKGKGYECEQDLHVMHIVMTGYQEGYCTSTNFIAAC